MRIIAKRTLQEFRIKHPQSKQTLIIRYKEILQNQFHSPKKFLEYYPRTSILEGNRIVFRLKGNDYLAKPFYPEELLARIKERFEVNPDVKVEEEIYHFANTVFDYSTNEIRTGNSKTLVTSRQAEILRILARNPNVAIDREIILSAVWGNVSYANSLALNVQVTYLRKALRNDPSTSIVSLTKKGYMLKG